MPITIKVDSEPTWEWIHPSGEARVWGVKPSSALRDKLFAKYTKRGEYNATAHNAALLARCVRGWDGIIFTVKDEETGEEKPLELDPNVQKDRNTFVKLLATHMYMSFMGCVSEMNETEFIAEEGEEEEEDADPLPLNSG